MSPPSPAPKPAPNRIELVGWSLVVAGLGAAGLGAASTFLVPFVVACFLALLIGPAQTWLEQKGLPRPLGVILGLAAVLCALGLLGLLFARAGTSVASESGAYADRLREGWSELSAFAKDRAGVDLNQMVPDLGGMSGKILSRASSWLGTLNTFLGGLVFTLLHLGFLLGNRDRVKAKVERLAVRLAGSEEVAQETLQTLASNVRTYLWVKLCISVPTGLALGSVAWAFGVDFPLTWGILAFAGSFVPSIGPLVATIPPVVIAFLGLDPLTALAASLCMAGVLQISASVVEPTVLGDALNLSFPTIIMSIFVWGMIWRAPGLVLAVPLTACIVTLLLRSKRFEPLGELLKS